jgi:hypothetical protein
MPIAFRSIGLLDVVWEYASPGLGCDTFETCSYAACLRHLVRNAGLDFFDSGVRFMMIFPLDSLLETGALHETTADSACR